VVEVSWRIRAQGAAFFEEVIYTVEGNVYLRYRHVIPKTIELQVQGAAVRGRLLLAQSYRFGGTLVFGPEAGA